MRQSAGALVPPVALICKWLTCSKAAIAKPPWYGCEWRPVGRQDTVAEMPQ